MNPEWKKRLQKRFYMVATLWIAVAITWIVLVTILRSMFLVALGPIILGLTGYVCVWWYDRWIVKVRAPPRAQPKNSISSP